METLHFLSTLTTLIYTIGFIFSVASFIRNHVKHKSKIKDLEDEIMRLRYIKTPGKE